MGLIPYKKYTLSTKLSFEEVIQKLSDQIEPVDNYRYLSNDVDNVKPYEGYILDNKFKIRRIPFLNNKFPTIIKGTIIEQSKETEINIVMRLNVFSLFLMLLVLVAVVFCIIIMIDQILSSKMIDPAVLFILAFMFLIAIPSYLFRLESSKSQKFLSELLEK